MNEEIIMATTAEKSADEKSAVKYDTKWYLKDFKRFVATFLAILVMYASISASRLTFAANSAIGSADHLLKRQWMNLLLVEIVFQLILVAALGSYFWKLRDLHLDQITPREELRRYLNLTLWLIIYTYSVYWAGSYFAEQDNAWLKTANGYDVFTANHVTEFYLCFSFYTIMGISSWFYARTQLPQYAKSISLPLTLAVAGPFTIFVVVGFNEWSHAFWFREELYEAYIHNAFVIGVWFALAVGGILLQCMIRMSELIDWINNETTNQ